MNEGAGCLGGLVALVLFGSIFGVGGLLLTSHAVLYSEEKVPDTKYFVCSYFTGLRTVTLFNDDPTGCKRFIPVGGS